MYFYIVGKSTFNNTEMHKEFVLSILIKLSDTNKELVLIQIISLKYFAL